MIFDAAVVIPTILRPDLDRAVRSVYAQDFTGTLQILVGVDIAKGSRDQVEVLQRDCPKNMELRVIDPGFSTSEINGGFYPVRGGGILRTVLSYLANSRYVAYLDDDNWWGPEHVSSLRAAIEGHDWAFSYRWYVHPETHAVICVDRWESVGAGKGMYTHVYKYNGHVDTNCLMIDKTRCHWALPAWVVPHQHHKLRNRPGGAAEDRSMFHTLQKHYQGVASGKATSYYVINMEWYRVLKYLVNPVDPATLTDRAEQHFARHARQIDRTGIPPDAVRE